MPNNSPPSASVSTVEKSVIPGPDGLLRCGWQKNDPLYMRYHDEEWGNPLFDDIRLFEALSLEAFQAGLSWITILRKREGFRTAFDGFDFRKIAAYTERDVQRLLSCAEIIRHKTKITSTIQNARCALTMCEDYGSLANYIWKHSPASPYNPARRQEQMDSPPSEAAKAFSQDLKKRGWMFIGPQTAFAFMQAVGLVNGHLEGCYKKKLFETIDKDQNSF